jgi:glycosyltransferase involved in cell wall biosynthesis
MSKAMLFAPLPPPIGGITSITAMLHRELGHNAEILFVQPVPKTDTWKRLVRPLISVTRLVRGTLRVRRGGRVVFFCSSRASFWDKCVWAGAVLLMGRTVAMVMVAGDFPQTFAAAPRMPRALAHWLFRQPGLIVAAQSASWMGVYRNIFPKATVTQVGAAVDPEFFDNRDVRVARSYPLRLLFVGWITADKGIVDLLDAVQSIASSLDGRARIRLVGPMFGREGFWHGELDRRGIGSLVELAGPVTSRADIVREYREADAFVFPSHSEGFPVALLEATAAGLPCIATNVGGVADILDGSRTGMIVTPKSPPSLAAAIETLVSDQALRRSLGSAAAEYARQAFSLEACVGSYARLLGVR